MTTTKKPRSPGAEDGAVKRALHLWVVLSRAYAAVQAHAQADVARHGLTIAEFGVLEALYHKGPLRLGEVQAKVLVSSGGTTWLADRLEARGLVRRVPAAEDRRARVVALTPAGERLVRRIFPAHARRIRDALAGLGAAEQRDAIRLLRALGLHAAGSQAREPSDA
ncbi:MAG TPA: MarR family transcriptional regulator [Gemmatimonadaceae bacterium]